MEATNVSPPTDLAGLESYGFFVLDSRTGQLLLPSTDPLLRDTQEAGTLLLELHSSMASPFPEPLNLAIILNQKQFSIFTCTSLIRTPQIPGHSISLYSDVKSPQKATSVFFLCVLKHPERARHMAHSIRSVLMERNSLPHFPSNPGGICLPAGNCLLENNVP